MANFAFTKLLSSLVQKRFLSTCSKIPPLHSPLTEITKASNFALHFLTNSCGLPLKSAISVSQKFQIQQENEKKLQSVIDYLKDEGFSQTNIAKFIQKWPSVLHSKFKTSLNPKFEFLKQKGFVGELLVELLVRDPGVVKISLASRMKPSFEFLKYYLKSDDKVVSAIRRSSWLLSSGASRYLQPNIDFLVKEGVPDTSIAKLLRWDPRTMMQTHICRTIYAVNGVKNFGFQPSSSSFVHAFRVMLCMNESTWKKRMKFFKSYGWSEDEILMAFKRFPYMMSYSEGRIRKSLDFYLNIMKLDPQTVIAKSEILAYAIDTRVRPRYTVLKILEPKKLIKEDRHRFNLSWIIISNKIFLDKYVIKYVDNIPDLLDTYSAGIRAEKMAT